MAGRSKPGEPIKRPVDVRSKMIRRSHTPSPQYHAHLPKVYPFKLTLSLEDALYYSGLLVDRMEDSLGELRLYFALTGHPAATDGHVTLWLSRGSAEYMLESDWVGSVEETVWQPEVLERRAGNAEDRGNPRKTAKEARERAEGDD